MNDTQDTQSPQDSQAAPSGDILDPVEIRVLGVLAEKEAATPDNYPLSLNALTNGCNQLTSRDPVMALGEDEIADALQQLVGKKLVSEVSQSGARVLKYEHRMRIKWLLEQDKLAILAILMLRGPQTAGEIRNRIGRLYDFGSVDEVEQGLGYLMDKYPPLVARLPRAPGAKEARYAQLLGGEIVEGESMPDAAPSRSGSASTQALEQQVAELREQVASLARQFEEFKRQFD